MILPCSQYLRSSWGLSVKVACLSRLGQTPYLASGQQVTHSPARVVGQNSNAAWRPFHWGGWLWVMAPGTPWCFPPEHEQTPDARSTTRVSSGLPGATQLAILELNWFQSRNKMSRGNIIHWSCISEVDHSKKEEHHGTSFQLVIPSRGSLCGLSHWSKRDVDIFSRLRHRVCTLRPPLVHVGKAFSHLRLSLAHVEPVSVGRRDHRSKAPVTVMSS